MSALSGIEGRHGSWHFVPVLCVSATDLSDAGSRWMKPWWVDWKRVLQARLTESKVLVVIAAEADGPGIGRIRMRVIEDASAAASLHSELRRAGKPAPHRWLARLLGTGPEGVPAGGHGAAGAQEGSLHADASRSPDRRVVEAVAARRPPSTTYIGAIETAEEFAPRIYREAYQRGLSRAAIKVVLGDGVAFCPSVSYTHGYQQQKRNPAGHHS
jgi:hypothetical protein